MEWTDFCISVIFGWLWSKNMPQKLGKWAKNRVLWIKRKISSLIFTEFFIMKIYVNCWVPAQILYLGKIFFVRYRPNCSKPIRLQVLNQLFLQNKWMKQPHFLHVDANSNIESYSKNLWLCMVKIWVWLIQSLDSKLNVYLKNEQME